MCKIRILIMVFTFIVISELNAQMKRPSHSFSFEDAAVRAGVNTNDFSLLSKADYFTPL